MKTSLVPLVLLTAALPAVRALAAPSNDQLLALMAERYDRDMSNESGRVSWHGKVVQAVVSTNALGELIKTQTYADGFTYDIKARAASPLAPKVSNTLPQRLKEAQERRAAELATTNLVTITTTLKKEKN